jgi:hypothetical protein
MSETVTATMAIDQVDPTTFRYTISLTDTSATSPVGTFWFAWEPCPCLNFLPDPPNAGSITSPAGWTVNVTNSNSFDGFGVQWVAGTGSALQPGQTFSYSFETPDTPAQIFAPSTQDPTFPVTESFVYSGGPFSDAGVGFVVPCFCAGTRILTVAGEVPVEDAAVGDLVPTWLGGHIVPVRWIGHRTIDCGRHNRPQDVWPVRVRAGAFGPGRPIRDLLLSPDHAIHVEGDGEGAAPGVLIPVRHLVNGVTIAQEAVDRVEYWHVELPAHDVLLAEGLAVESYLDTGNRCAFANGGPALLAHPDFALAVWATDGCAPLVRTGPTLAAVKQRLLRHAETLGYRRTADPVLHLVVDDTVLLPKIAGSRYRFRLPDGAHQVRLRSLSAVPAEITPESTDCRRLGAAVARLAVDGIAVPLGNAAYANGWHAAEPRNGAARRFRWTDGDATIICPKARRLEVTILPMSHYYWADDIGAAATAPHRTHEVAVTQVTTALAAAAGPGAGQPTAVCVNPDDRRYYDVP